MFFASKKLNSSRILMLKNILNNFSTNESILSESLSPSIGKIIINKPPALNAIDLPMIRNMNKIIKDWSFKKVRIIFFYLL